MMSFWISLILCQRETWKEQVHFVFIGIQWRSSAECYVKIGKFEGSELLYQDEVHGSLILMADRVIDLIYLKYLKAAVTYHKETRVETYPYAREAVCEAVYNALIHCNWADNISGSDPTYTKM